MNDNRDIMKQYRENKYNSPLEITANNQFITRYPVTADVINPTNNGMKDILS